MPGVRSTVLRIVLLFGMLMAGCGGQTADETTVPTTLPPASTTTPTTATTSVPGGTTPGTTTSTAAVGPADSERRGEIHTALASQLHMQLGGGTPETWVCTKHVYDTNSEAAEPTVYAWARCQAHAPDGTVLESLDSAFYASFFRLEGQLVLGSFGTSRDPNGFVASEFPRELAEAVLRKGVPEDVLFHRGTPTEVCPDPSADPLGPTVHIGPGTDYPSFLVLEWGTQVPTTGNRATSYTGSPWLEVVVPDGGLGWVAADKVGPPPCAIPPALPATTTTTTTTVPTNPLFSDDGGLAALPGPTDLLPGAHPAASVPWSQIDSQWILLTLENGGSTGLYLLDPGDRLFSLGGWPAGRQLADWDGRRVLFITGQQVKVVDLFTGATVEVPAAGYLTAALDPPPGGGFTVRQDLGHRVVVTSHYADAGLGPTLLNVDRRRSGGRWSTPSWLHHPNGEQVVLADIHGVRLATTRGEPIRTLDTPGLECVTVRWWAPEAVLVSCLDEAYAAGETYEMWPGSGGELWAVPLDGGGAARIGPDPGPPDQYRDPMDDAVRLGDVIAIQFGGCCECGGGLDLYLPSGGVIAPESVQCSPDIITVRNGWVVVLTIDYDAGLGPALIEVASDGTSRMIDLGGRGIIGSIAMRGEMA